MVVRVADAVSPVGERRDTHRPWSRRSPRLTGYFEITIEKVRCAVTVPCFDVFVSVTLTVNV